LDLEVSYRLLGFTDTIAEIRRIREIVPKTNRYLSLNITNSEARTPLFLELRNRTLLSLVVEVESLVSNSEREIVRNARKALVAMLALFPSGGDYLMTAEALEHSLDALRKHYDVLMKRAQWAHDRVK
jgi:hypothetical protein